MADSGSPLSVLLEQRLSVERLRPYRVATGRDLDGAIALYQWNTAAAGAFFEDLGHLEVVLRNALHLQLTLWHNAADRPGQWYDDPAGLLDRHRHEDISIARDDIPAAGLGLAHEAGEVDHGAGEAVEFGDDDPPGGPGLDGLEGGGEAGAGQVLPDRVSEWRAARVQLRWVHSARMAVSWRQGRGRSRPVRRWKSGCSRPRSRGLRVFWGAW